MLKRLAGRVGLFLILACLIASGTSVAYAVELQSNNYQIDETIVGAGGLDQSSSTNYQLNTGTNDLSIGESSSGNYVVQAGSETTTDPTLSFIVSNSAANFSTFSPSNPSTATAAFSVLNYTSWGYVVQVYGAPPTNGSHSIAAMSSTDISRIGQEQFGINLVANSSPVSFGANPDNGQFGFGSINANYNTAGSFRYVEGETIATAPKSSGITLYTISYLVNVASVTPGGQYVSNQTIVIIGTY